MSPLIRLRDRFYNSRPLSAGNPGGLAGDGHVTNFPAALEDVGLVGQQVAADRAILEAAGVPQAVSTFDSKVNKNGDRMTGPLVVATTAPHLRLEDTDGAVDQKNLRLAWDANALVVERWNDALTAGLGQLFRASPNRLTLPAGLTVNGTQDVTGDRIPHNPTASITAESGTPTSVVGSGDYRAVGKEGSYGARITIGNPGKGTAIGGLRLTLPFTSIGGRQHYGRGGDSGGNVLQVYALGNQLNIYRAGFATPWVDGNIIDIEWAGAIQ